MARLCCRTAEKFGRHRRIEKFKRPPEQSIHLFIVAQTFPSALHGKPAPHSSGHAIHFRFIVTTSVKSKIPSLVVLWTSILALLPAGCATQQAPRSATSTDDHSLAKAWQIIQSKKFVDLTHTFSPTTPVWEGFGQATFSPAADPATGRPYAIARDGFHALRYSLVGQYGTHIDPPAHFASSGMTLDELPVKDMILPLVFFDMTPMLHDEPNHALTVADILAWEKDPRPRAGRLFCRATDGHV